MCVSAGWDTDSNGGNMGALLAIMHGLDGFNDGPDWRGYVFKLSVLSIIDQMLTKLAAAEDPLQTGCRYPLPTEDTR